MKIEESLLVVACVFRQIDTVFSPERLCLLYEWEKDTCQMRGILRVYFVPISRLQHKLWKFKRDEQG